MAHPLETMMESGMTELKQLADVNTVVGAPIRLGEDRMILPVSSVSLGFVSGGGEYGVKNPVMQAGTTMDGGRGYPFASTIAAGMALRPIAFLAVNGDRVSVLKAEETGWAGQMLSAVPELMTEVRKLIQYLRQEKTEA